MLPRSISTSFGSLKKCSTMSVFSKHIYAQKTNSFNVNYRTFSFDKIKNLQTDPQVQKYIKKYWYYNKGNCFNDNNNKKIKNMWSFDYLAKSIVKLINLLQISIKNKDLRLFMILLKLVVCLLIIVCLAIYSCVTLIYESSWL